MIMDVFLNKNRLKITQSFYFISTNDRDEGVILIMATNVNCEEGTSLSHFILFAYALF